MAYTIVVLLLVACVSFIQGQSPYGPRFGFDDDERLVTCIGTNEAFDQIRITLRKDDDDRYGHSRAFQYGRTDPRLIRTQWRVSALFIPAQALGLVSRAGTASLRGTFYLGVTKNGRHEGKCAGLGGILMEDDLIQVPGQNPFSRLGRSPYMSPYGSQFGGLRGLSSFGNYGHSLGISPFGLSGNSLFGRGSSLFGAQQFGGQQFGGSPFGGQRFGGSFGGRSLRRGAPGMIQDTLLAGAGGNVYTSVLKGLSYADLKGRGMALCLDQYCFKPTTTCCILGEDDTPATENVGAFPGGPVDGNSILNQINNNGGQFGGINGFGNNIGGINNIAVGNTGISQNNLLLTGDGVGDLGAGDTLF